MSDESEYDRLSIPTVSSESKQIFDGLAPDSQKKNEFRLPSDHQYPSPDELESLYTEYSSAGGLCSKQGYLLNLTALEQLNHTHQVVPHARLSGDYPNTAARPFAFDFDCACAFCGSQHKGKHQLRMHLIKVHLVEPPLIYQKTGIASNKKGPGADAIIKCICGIQEDDGIMVICTRCKTWQHNTCYYYWGESLIGFPTSCHECEDCEPRKLDAKGATKRMDFFRRVKYVTLGSIGQESRLLSDPNFDEAQEKHSSDQNPDAFKSKNGSALKKVDSSHSGLSIALDYEETLIQQSKERFPQHSDNQPDLVHYESESPVFYIHDPEQLALMTTPLLGRHQSRRESPEFDYFQTTTISTKKE